MSLFPAALQAESLSSDYLPRGLRSHSTPISIVKKKHFQKAMLIFGFVAAFGFHLACADSSWNCSFSYEVMFQLQDLKCYGTRSFDECALEYRTIVQKYYSGTARPCLECPSFRHLGGRSGQRREERPHGGRRLAYPRGRRGAESMSIVAPGRAGPGDLSDWIS